MHIKYFKLIEKGNQRSLQEFKKWSQGKDYDGEYMHYPSSQKAFELHPKFDEEWKSAILAYMNNLNQLRAYLMIVYVNGLRGIEAEFKSQEEHVLRLRFKNNTAKALEDEVFVALSNYHHGISLMSSQVREYLLLTCEIRISDVDFNKYNISGNYYGEFELKLTGMINSSADGDVVKRKITSLRNKYWYLVIPVIVFFVIMNFGQQLKYVYDEIFPRKVRHVSEIAGEQIAVLDSLFTKEKHAIQFQAKLQRMADISGMIEAPVDSFLVRNPTYFKGLFFDKYDVVVEKSIEHEGKWIVALDIIDGKEIDSIANERLELIKQRLIIYDKLEVENEITKELKVLLNEYGDLIWNSKITKYDIASYIRMYDQDLINTKLLEKR
ncbi:hypothetical protein [Reichenbachiella sp.]|uniref:hypothetical protein n=1 Tax=Reichenbachiella sp. TaxID=2184521 RepID=UPI00329944BF